MKKLNLKFDVKEMTEQFNNVTDLSYNQRNGDNYCLTHLTKEQMSEMIQKHAFKLGYCWNGGIPETYTGIEYLFLTENAIMFNRDESDHKIDLKGKVYKKAGLEFFSIKPEPKMVDCRITETMFRMIKCKDIIVINKEFIKDCDLAELIK